MDDFEKFLNTTNNLGFIIPGMFDMNKDTLIRLYNLFLNTGKNYTDVFAKIYGEYRDGDFRHEYESYMFETIKECLDFRDNLNELYNISNLVTKDIYNVVSGSIDRNIEMLETIDSNESTRKKSTSFINSHKNEILEKHGSACLCCGSIKNIEMDHVIPVSKGGKNETDNFQPLCKSCNISKGVKTIDYRNN